MIRRYFLLGLGGFLFNVGQTNTVLSQTSGTVFNIRWRDLDVGYSSINLRQISDRIYVDVDVKINVSIFKIELFSYSLKCNEIWKKKSLMSLNSEVLIGKKREFCNVKRSSNGLEVRGSAFSGVLHGNPGTTSYFTPDFLKREIWISTQNGKPLKISAKNLGVERIDSPLGTIRANNWEVSGDLNLNLYYDKHNEWVASSFKAGGSLASFVLYNKVGRINQIWEHS